MSFPIQLEAASRRSPRNPRGRWSPGLSLLRLREALEQRGAGVESLICVAFIGGLGYLQVVSNGALVVALLAVVFYEFEKRMDQGLPLMQVAALVAVLQWTVGASLAYNTNLIEGRYAMYINEASYFSYALPGTAAYVFGLLAVGSSVRQREVLRSIRREHFMTIGWLLNGAAWVAHLAAPMVPGSLAFAVHLLSQLGYVGALYFLFSRDSNRWLGVAVSMYPLFKSSAESAMFHDVLLWTGLLFCYWYGMRRRTATAKVGMLLIVGLAMFTVQAIKQNYRLKLMSGQNASVIGDAVDFWGTRGSATRDDVLANVIMRLNQGWIISAAMRHVPAEEPYCRGETLKDALVASVLPRILAGGKAASGGVVNFRRFTGLDLADETSMTICGLGEGYVNFGREGGIALMLGFGLAFASFYALCLRYSVTHATFLFWVPLIFYQTIKAETEFVTVINQVTKGAVVAFGLHWLIDLLSFRRRTPKPKKRRAWIEPRGGERETANPA